MRVRSCREMQMKYELSRISHELYCLAVNFQASFQPSLLVRSTESAMRANVFHRIEHGAGVTNDEWWTVSDHNLTPRLAAIDAYVEHQLITWRGLFKFASNLRSPFAKIIFRCLRTAYPMCAYVGLNCRIWWALCECVRFMSADRIARRTYPNGPDVRLSSHTHTRARDILQANKANEWGSICFIYRFWHFGHSTISHWDSIGLSSSTFTHTKNTHSSFRCGKSSDNDNEYSFEWND